jgi:hypothetical protein
VQRFPPFSTEMRDRGAERGVSIRKPFGRPGTPSPCSPWTGTWTWCSPPWWRGSSPRVASSHGWARLPAAPRRRAPGGGPKRTTAVRAVLHPAHWTAKCAYYAKSAGSVIRARRLSDRRAPFAQGAYPTDRRAPFAQGAYPTGALFAQGAYIAGIFAVSLQNDNYGCDARVRR